MNHWAAKERTTWSISAPFSLKISHEVTKTIMAHLLPTLSIRSHWTKAGIKLRAEQNKEKQIYQQC